jgi:hypothetical protein
MQEGETNQLSITKGGYSNENTNSLPCWNNRFGGAGGMWYHLHWGIFWRALAHRAKKVTGMEPLENDAE